MPCSASQGHLMLFAIKKLYMVFCHIQFCGGKYSNDLYLSFCIYMLLHLYMAMYASRFGWQDLARLRARHCGEPCKAFTPCYLLDNSNITRLTKVKIRSFFSACCSRSIIVHFSAEWNTFEKYSSQKVVFIFQKKKLHIST